MDDRSFKKTANIRVRIQKPLKDIVEGVLSELGVTIS